jgi:hypothetical protein
VSRRTVATVHLSRGARGRTKRTHRRRESAPGLEIGSRKEERGDREGNLAGRRMQTSRRRRPGHGEWSPEARLRAGPMNPTPDPFPSWEVEPWGWPLQTKRTHLPTTGPAPSVRLYGPTPCRSVPNPWCGGPVLQRARERLASSQGVAIPWIVGRSKPRFAVATLPNTSLDRIIPNPDESLVTRVGAGRVGAPGPPPGGPQVPPHPPPPELPAQG